MMNNVNSSRVSVIIHAIAAILMGFASVQIAAASRALFAAGAGILILIIAGFITQKIVGKKGFKFWAGTGIFIYLFTWLLTWTYLINL